LNKQQLLDGLTKLMSKIDDVNLIDDWPCRLREACLGWWRKRLRGCLGALGGQFEPVMGFKSRFEHFWGVIRQFKDSIQQPTIGIRFDLGDEIRQQNHCWLLLISPFQCLVVSAVELTGFNWFR